ncbi:hypothetical protein AM493_04430 [Flavobacterium akiainvivens]|uniref:DUF3300 domain-containing protein n=1 Tax=Flavobacterium akiainvivens TaxID=1202724 RepID=A0A0M8MFT3_9FLAO|nr:hypothetical protein [Flavobacterium akiainvivens]KOS05361.1 hypothetical protein AM493_04430 [Flavobacterium akiainvivens]SFQ73983.1 hypothetical protein SAMN05444144_11964 [Flavobacterium akiainvivens]
MKTSIINTALVAFLSIGSIFAQDVTTVTANNTDISDNLDLQAVASIFGESSDLEDFERRLNDPKNQISNLDLNGDNRVDYLRVIEATESNTHVIILQAVLAVDTFQDVATIEVERDSSNNVSVQVVGDVYMYGPNYIYEPVYAVRPVMFNVFWANTYRPYYSPWYWGYYPTYYTYWTPYPVYRYRRHIHNHINVHNTYVYVDNRRSTRAVNIYSGRRQNAYERQYPNRSFSNRNANVSNRRELEQTREVATRNNSRGTTNGRSSLTPATNNGRSNSTITRDRTTSTESNATRINTTTRGNATRPSVSTETPSVRNTPERTNSTPERITTPQRANSTPATVRSTPQRTTTIEQRSTPAVQQRSNTTPAVRNTPSAPQRQQSVPAVRNSEPQRQSAPAVRSTPQAAPRQSAPASNRGGNSSGGRRG